MIDGFIRNGSIKTRCNTQIVSKATQERKVSRVLTFVRQNYELLLLNV